MDDIGRRLHQLRLAAGLTMEDLAKLTGYKDKSSISKIEKGQADIPLSRVEPIAHALHTSPKALLFPDAPGGL